MVRNLKMRKGRPSCPMPRLAKEDRTRRIEFHQKRDAHHRQRHHSQGQRPQNDIHEALDDPLPASNRRSGSRRSGRESGQPQGESGPQGERAHPQQTDRGQSHAASRRQSFHQKGKSRSVRRPGRRAGRPPVRATLNHQPARLARAVIKEGARSVTAASPIWSFRACGVCESFTARPGWRRVTSTFQ